MQPEGLSKTLRSLPVTPSWFDLVMHDLNQALAHTPPEYAGHRHAIMAVQDYFAKGTKRGTPLKKSSR